MAAEPEAFTGPDGETRLRDTELVIPVVTGTVALYLGKKATEYTSHRWTVYIRGLDNEDLSHIISKVVFKLHPSFQNPVREISKPPFELTEHGWGEFDIVVVIHFAEDSLEPPVEIFHKLKLYAESDSNNQGTKKPVVSEHLEELVFSEPVQAFHQRVTNQVLVPAPPYTIAPHFTHLNAEPEVQRYNALRLKVAHMKANLQRQWDSLQ